MNLGGDEQGIVVPTPVGVNRLINQQGGDLLPVVPTPVGVNRASLTTRGGEPLPSLSR